MSALSLNFGPDFAREVAEQLAEVLLERGVVGTGSISPLLTVPEAAAYMRCTPQRLHDLSSQGRLVPLKDGSRSLYSRQQLDAYLRGEAS